MTKLPIFLSFFLIIVWIGCQDNSENQLDNDIPEQVVLETAVLPTPSPTSSQIPSKTIEPTTPTETLTPHPTALPTFTKAPTNPPITPLPKTIPVEGSENYHLRSWNQNDAMQIWQMLYDRADFNFWDPLEQHYAENLGREIRLRFPEMKDNLDWQWQFLRVQSLNDLRPRVYRAEDFVNVFEQSLNSDIVSLSNLSPWMEERGFEVVNQLEAPNLYGDGVNKWVVHIATMSQVKKGLTLIIQPVETNQFQVTSLRDVWEFYDLGWGGWEEIEVADRNGNGRSDITSIITSHGHNGCGVDFAMYEWKDGERQFTNIAPVPDFGLLPNRCQNIWHFERSLDNKSQNLIFELQYQNNVGNDCQGFQKRDVYEWIDEQYQFSFTEYEPYDESQPDYCRVGWADFAQPELAIPVFEGVDQWDEQMYLRWGAASQDYFQYRLGIWYALTGNVAKTHEVMTMLADSPVNPDYPLLSEIAKQFLEQYNTKADLYAACRAINKYVNTEWGLIESNWEPDGATLIGDKFQEWAGFHPPQWGQWVGSMCVESSAFRLSFEEWNGNESLEIWLDEHRIPFQILAKHDLDGDGTIDKLIDIASRTYVVLEQDAQVLISIPVSLTIDLGTVKISEYHPEHFDAKTYIIKTENDMVIFQLVDGNINVLLDEYGRSHTLTWTDEEKQITIWNDHDSQTMYRWDETSNRFIWSKRITPYFDQSNLLTDIETALYENGDGETAVTLLQQLSQQELLLQLPLDTPIEPYLIYLEGLANELDGKENEAISHYYLLWKIYPDSLFTTSVRYKLRLNGDGDG